MTRLLIATLVLVFACGSAMAQFGGMRRGGQDGEGRGRQRPDSQLSGVTQMSASDQVRMQLTDARLALKLEAAQNPLFDAYQDKVFALLSDLGRGVNAPSGEDTLKQIDRKVDVARNRLTAMEEISDAAKKLYAGLTPEQKTVADRVIPGTVPALYVQSSPYRGDSPRAPR